jgi:predicted nuclease of predicted toxin-antitoxin system
MRFHLDEQANPRIADGLRQMGINVTTTTEAGIRTAPDRAQLDYAIRERRILVTHDDDFTRYEGGDHPGIVYCHQDALTVGDIVRYLSLMAQVMTEDEMRGHVEFIKRL